MTFLRNKAFLLTLGLIALVTGSIMLIRYSLTDTVSTNQKIPDGVMIQVHYSEYSQTGQLHTLLSTPLMRHYTLNNTALFKSPKMTLITTNDIHWHMSAEHGRSIHGNKKIFLWGHVKLHHRQLPNHPRTTITTSAVTIYPKQSLAKTDRLATIIRPGTIVHGQGVIANLKRGMIELLTHSQGTYNYDQATHPAT